MSLFSNTLKAFIPQDMRMRNFVRDERVKSFASYTPFLSFLSANLVMIFLFNYFFHISSLIGFFSIPLYVLGIVASLAIIKTSLFLDFKDTIVKREKKREKTADEQIEQYNSCPNLGRINNYLIFQRLFFFNVLNDLFVLTLFWSSLFFIFYFIPFSFGWISLPQEFNFNNFVALITLIGIMAGFFQLYIPNYKETVVQKIQNSVNKYLKNCLKGISPWDFIEFLEENSDNSELAKKVRNFLESNEDISQKYMEKYKKVITKGSRRRYPDLVVYNLLSPATRDPISIFKNIDHYAEYQLSEEEREIIKENYLLYLNQKKQQFIGEIQEMDLNDVRTVVFSNITFFDETFSDYISLNFESVTRTENLNYFEDFLQDYALNCIFEFFDILYNIQEIKKE